MTTLVRPALRFDAQGLELRHVTGLQPFQVRAAGDGEEIPFEGYAAKFNERSQDLGGFFEVIAPGAFAGALTRDDVRFTLNHDPNFVLARRRGDPADTLDLEEDAIGLKVSARMAPTSYARDLATVMRRGDVTGMSFRFRTLRDDWTFLPGGIIERTLIEVQLRDVSVVTYPAYLAAEGSVRAQDFSGLASALGLDELDEERRAEALAVIARGGEPGDVLAAVRAITHPAPTVTGTPIRDHVSLRSGALATLYRLPRNS